MEADGEPTLSWTRRVELLSAAIGVTVTALAALAAVLVSVWINRNETDTTRGGQITDRYTAAVGNLGNPSADVRLGGVYALQRIMKDSPRDQASVVDVLSAYIRTHSRPAGTESAGYSGRPEADVQAAFEVLARRNPRQDGSAVVDLREARLPHVAVRSTSRNATIELDLTAVDQARLPNSNLSGADLSKANLPGSDFRCAYLVGAVLDSAALKGADLRWDWLDDADLGHARLEGAQLEEASLVDASLAKASLLGANMRNADMRGVDLDGAVLTGADLRGADLHTGQRIVNGKPSGWTSRHNTHVTAAQLASVRLDSRTILPPEIADDPRIKARIVDSQAGPSPSQACGGHD
ncbi:pentapeptide repeat-containing protein [Streptomyces sp. NPDC086989]|uniref:pentapeptide repeat-containing protein n=1 Tax=Streptomyces sp. NPDC086989 TaxID=3365764 RepID=UPI0037F6D52A